MMPDKMELPKYDAGLTTPTLPSLTIDHMDFTDLCAFIPQMMQSVTKSDERRTEKPSSDSTVPEWWPEDVPFGIYASDPRDKDHRKSPWVDVLRNVVRSCYRFYGNEHLLMSSAAASNCHAPTSMHMYNNKDGSVSILSGSTLVTVCNTAPKVNLTASNIKSERKSKRLLEKEFVDEPVMQQLYICYFCDSDYANRETLMQHQQLCSKRPTELQRIMVSPRKPPARQQPKASEKSKLRHHPREHVEKPSFVSALGLISKSELKTLERDSRKSIEVINVVNDSPPAIPVSPRMPTTPRTPKSLISFDNQFNHGAKEVICISSSDEEDVDEESDAQSNNDGNRSAALNKNSGLLNIDVTSNLGRKLKQHIESFELHHLSVVKDYDHFCHTPRKSRVYSKLRDRDNNFPVMFRKRKATRHAHVYKFTRRQRENFMSRLRTGLDAKSRVLSKQMRPCSVIVRRLTREKIDFFARRTRFPVLERLRQSFKSDAVSAADMPSVFPTLPALVSPNVDRLLGLKTKTSNLLSSANIALAIRGETSAQMTQQKVTVYKSLLSDYTHFIDKQKKIQGIGSKTQPLIIDISDSDSNDDTNRERPTKKQQPQPQGPVVGIQPPQVVWVGPGSPGQVMGRLSPSVCLSQDNNAADTSNASRSKSVDDEPLRATNTAKRRLLNSPTDLPASKRQRKDDDVAVISEKSTTFSPHVVFRCHLCTTESHYKNNAQAEINRHILNKHKGEVVHLMDYRPHKSEGQSVHIVEAMARVPTAVTRLVNTKASGKQLKPVVRKPTTSTTTKPLSSAHNVKTNSLSKHLTMLATGKNSQVSTQLQSSQCSQRRESALCAIPTYLHKSSSFQPFVMLKSGLTAASDKTGNTASLGMMASSSTKTAGAKTCIASAPVKIGANKSTPLVVMTRSNSPTKPGIVNTQNTNVVSTSATKSRCHQTANSALSDNGKTERRKTARGKNLRRVSARAGSVSQSVAAAPKLPTSLEGTGKSARNIPPSSSAPRVGDSSDDSEDEVVLIDEVICLE